jgi:integrase/recombinase XerD
MGYLRDRMIEDMKLNGYSDKTIEMYTACLGAFSRHFGKSPLRIGRSEIRDFFLHMMRQKASPARLHIFYCALKSFYKSHGLPGYLDFMKRPKVPRSIPAVLDESEIEVILSLCRTLRYKMLFALIYSAGLRVSEALDLKISDIDPLRKTIRVRSTKSGKDRYTILSDKASVMLRHYLNRYGTAAYLFASKRDKSKKLSKRQVQQVFGDLVREAGIAKKAHVHTLRHSFATHLLERNTNIFYIMNLLGHSSIKSTEIYLHMQRLDKLSISSPLDTGAISLEALPRISEQPLLRMA